MVVSHPRTALLEHVWNTQKYLWEDLAGGHKV